jgi:uncharacterized protein YecE (DUF72 family)
MSILIGTASWTDKTLIACGRFYPPRGCSTAEARLRFYASRFPIVEVDSSYYAMPAPATAQLWAERTPPGFTFNVKAFRLFTGHQTPRLVLHRDIQQALAMRRPSAGALFYRNVPPDVRVELWRRFHEALGPLVRAGKLGMVHFQFPPWVQPDREGTALVRHVVEQMHGLTVGLEFRHSRWWQGAQAAATLALERELQVVHTVVDGPQGFDNSVPAVWAATRDDVALVRLHGRNTATWDIKGAVAASDRFNYDYGDDELQPVAAETVQLARQVARTHVVFNNNQGDQGQRNARTLMAILGDAAVDPALRQDTAVAGRTPIAVHHA